MANKLFQKNRSFEPPVPKQFRIERSDNVGLKTEFADFANLLAALFQKMNCVSCCRILGCPSIIHLFLITASGNPVVFYAGEFSYSVRDRPQMLYWQIETNVAIKFPVNWIAWVASLCTPDLAAGVGIACERRRSGRCIAGRID